MSKSLRIGEILIDQGVMSRQQVFEVLQAQKRLHLPFGVLAEQMFEVTLESIEQAWVSQYHDFTGTIDLSEVRVDDEALRLIHRRQAWQFEILPVHIDSTGELLIAASRSRLARAVTFAANRLNRAVFFRIADREQLRTFLQRYYPMPEVSQSLIDRARSLQADGPA
ncbi:MAG: hypothetical protein WD009_10165 [Phycisphaeraceae bacterium]